MYEDKELLTLAAKAAGIECNDYGLDWFNRYWNPLTDDGDALRLAVKLGLGIEFFSSWVVANGGHDEDRESDPYAATRRAIVRAAAEISRGME